MHLAALNAYHKLNACLPVKGTVGLRINQARLPAFALVARAGRLLAVKELIAPVAPFQEARRDATASAGADARRLRVDLEDRIGFFAFD